MTYSLDFNGDLSVGGVLNNKRFSNVMINELFDIIYPVGSLYASFVELSGEKSSNGNSFYVTWRGCKWEYLYSSDKRYLTLPNKPTGSGSNWSVSETGGSIGGNKTHNHTVSGETNGHTLTSAEMPSHQHWTGDHGVRVKWINEGDGDASYVCPSFDGKNDFTTYTGYTGGQQSSIRDRYPSNNTAHSHTIPTLTTSTSNNNPLYQTIYLYKRVE